jgi:2-oxoglutarate dehydrogenase E2 component (dihydrolipoamide succinyltransferase)
MRVDMVMPQMGESITEGTIVRWTKKVGELVARDENVLDISTDKVDSEIPSPAAGRLVEIRAQDGETIPVGQVIAVIETEVGAAASTPAEAVQVPSVAPAAAVLSAATAPPAVSTQGSGSSLAVAPPVSTAAGPIPAASAALASFPLPAAAPPIAAAFSTAPPILAGPSPTFAPAPSPVLIPSAPAPVPVDAAAAPVVPPVPSMTGGGRTVSGPIPRHDGERFYSPLVRSIARVEGVGVAELAGIRGTGRDGRVTKDDLTAYVATRARGGGASAPAAVTGSPTGPPSASPAGAATLSNAATGASPAAGSGAAAGVLPGASFFGPFGAAEVAFKPYPAYAPAETRATGDGPIEVVKMDVMRQRIAEHMVRSKATSPHVASVTECDMTGIVRYREATKGEFERKHGFKLTYTPFIVTATVRALLDYPMMNASVEGTEILVKRFVNIGVAVALDNGLIVPVVKHAEEKNFLGLARAITDLAARARSKKLVPDEVAGGTFAVTNMGGYGNLFGLPIINQPNVGILGAGAIVKRPVVLGEAIAVRDIMYLSLSYDHRVVDGALGGYFIQRVRYHLEKGDLAAGV